MEKDSNKRNGRIAVYAELSKKQLGMVLRDEAYIEVPYGTELSSTIGKRGLMFFCANKKTAEELTNGLDSSSISWQIN